MDLESQLKAFGHAQVLVVLKPKKTKRVGSRTALALPETAAMQEEAASTLKPLFRRFADSRTQILAKETKRAASRRGGLESMGVTPARSTPPPPARYFPNLGVMLGTVDKKGLKALHARKKEVAAVMEAPEFSLISPHEVAALAGQPAGISWGITRLGVTSLWEKGLTGKGILIGHLDTGVDVTHPALTQSVDVFAEFDLIGEEVTAGGATAAATARDTGSHGTHTAGILNGQPHGGLDVRRRSWREARFRDRHRRRRRPRPHHRRARLDHRSRLPRRQSLAGRARFSPAIRDDPAARQAAQRASDRRGRQRRRADQPLSRQSPGSDFSRRDRRAERRLAVLVESDAADDAEAKRAGSRGAGRRDLVERAERQADPAVRHVDGDPSRRRPRRAADGTQARRDRPSTSKTRSTSPARAPPARARCASIAAFPTP